MIIDTMFSNNGIDQKYINDIRIGHSLVIVEKTTNSNILDDWQEPREFILRKIDQTTLHNSADFNESYSANVLVGECGTKLIIDDSMGIPMIEGYEVYPNFQSYFYLHGKRVKEVTARVKKEVNYIKRYQSFKKKIIDQNPEKLI